MKMCWRISSAMWPYKVLLLLVGISCLSAVSCVHSDKREQATLFEHLPADSTGIDFVNKLSYDEQFNIFTYRNFYNGGGVAIGDINNDGLPDIFFTSNLEQNRLYLNLGNFKFRDITSAAGIVKKSKWSTGACMADINGDGLLDIYVCNSGDVKGDDKKNELYINKGNLTFVEQAEAYGLADRGYSTQAAFFDFDQDGDLDMFMLNNSFRLIGSFNLQQNERKLRDSLGGQKLYRNDNGQFTDISEQAGIYGSKIAFGLGVSVSDVNNDGWPDIYVCNDFFERDYLYINQGNGTFKESLEDEIHSISYSAMGADIADINNDGYPDIFTSEMLPENESRLKTNTTFEDWDKYQLDLRYDYFHQFSRNMLQLNNGNGTFSEIGRYAGVQATDWSWGALITDLDNDGNKDIFISNGIFQDLTNGDYLQYISNPIVMKEMVAAKKRNHKLIEAMKSTPIPNYAYHNNGDYTFTNKSADWGLQTPGFSNGAAYADLDNDGDMDLVVNNVNMPAFVYRNNTNMFNPGNKYLRVKLEGEGMNTFAIGARVSVYTDRGVFMQEQMPVRGFQSSVDYTLVFGLGNTRRIDSLVVTWNATRSVVLKQVQPDSELKIKEARHNANDALQSRVAAVTPPAFFANDSFPGLNFMHHENEYSDFNRDKLLFHMLSTQGPAMAVGDVNQDGLSDLFIGGAMNQPAALYIQGPEGHFRLQDKKIWENDKQSEDVYANFFDADGDGDNDLFVCSGGNEFSPNSVALADRLYFNDGRGNFTKSPQLFPSAAGDFVSSSCVANADFDNDGDQDLFIGTRLIPTQYGYPCKGFILQNNGKGVFKDITAQVCPALENSGMVTCAKWFDYDRDGRPDLVIAGEYMPIRIFHNDGKGHLAEQTSEAGLSNSNGWWNCVEVADIDNDGFPDLVAGNHGLNSRFKASRQKPVSLYAGDFDRNGSIEQIITCYNGDSAYPVALRHDLVAVLPYLKKKLLHYEDYKLQTMEDIFSSEQLKQCVRSDAFMLSSCVLMNKRNKSFEIKPLPAAAQFSPVFALSVVDFNNDGFKDILLGGNFYESKPEAGIYDASFGLLATGNGKGDFLPVSAAKSGLKIRGCVRNIIPVHIGKKQAILVALNNGPLTILRYDR